MPQQPEVLDSPHFPVKAYFLSCWRHLQAYSSGIPEKAVGSLLDKNPEALGRYGGVALPVAVDSYSLLTHKT